MCVRTAWAPVELENTGEIRRARLHGLVHLIECPEYDLTDVGGVSRIGP
ncbi:MAG: hypothetical protein ABSC19_16675 [Syntrophorhabdales bacterium]